MSTFIAVVFPDDAKAFEGTRALRDLHAEGSITVFALAVIEKTRDGKVVLRQAADPGPIGTAIGAAVGGLLGVLAGPVGVVAGAAGGAVIGSLGDLFDLGIGREFLDQVSAELSPGKVAIVAEVAESWPVPLDTRMGALGARVVRTWRADLEGDRIASEIAAQRAAYEELKADYAHARDEAKAKLKASMDRAAKDLAKAQARASAKLETLDKERKARISELEQQFRDARGEAKAKLSQRMAALHADYELRSDKLHQAWELTKQAMAA